MLRVQLATWLEAAAADMSAEIGERVRQARKRRGLTQRELAGAAGVSVSLVRKLEQGSYGGVRLETAHRLAVVLRVTTSALISGRGDAGTEPDGAAAWEPVARAVRGDHDGRPDDEPGMGGLRDALADAAAVFLDSRYAELRGVLPLLLRDADALVSVSAGRDQARARQVRSEIRQLAASALAQVGRFAPAGDAVELAAGDAGDELTMLSAVDGKCFVLLRQGRLAECAALAADYAGRYQPAMTAGPEGLAAWGRLLLKASGVAARDNRPDDARETLRLARMAAAGVGREIAPILPWRVFGPVTVAMMRAETAAIQGRPDAVLAIGAQLTGRAYPVPRNFLRHRLDVAHAHVQMRRYAEAVGVLAQVQSAAPEWAAQQRYARDILGTVIARSRRLTSQARELAIFLRMPM
jgi:transcriptional regulator with XRE-family HTH domain